MTEIEMKKSLFDLLFYMRQSGRHSKYLDNIKHPAKKLKENEELSYLEKELEKIEKTKKQQSQNKNDEGNEN